MENQEFLNKKQNRDPEDKNEELESANKKKCIQEFQKPETSQIIENGSKYLIYSPTETEISKQNKEKENSQEKVTIVKGINEQTEKENEVNEEKKEKMFVSEVIINDSDKPSNSFDTNSENNSKKIRKKRDKKDKNEKAKEKMEKYLLKIKKGTKERDEALKKGYEKFKELKNEWDSYFSVLILTFENDLNNFQQFPEDYSYYIYNNLRGIRTTKEFKDIFENPPNDEKLYEEALKIYENRKQIFLSLAKKYQIKNLQAYINKYNKEQQDDETSLKNAKNNNTEGKVLNEGFLKLTQDYKTELFTASLVNCSLLRNEKDQERFNKDIKKDKDKQYSQIKIEASNFNISEDSMIGVITGLKFNNNITDINISGNMLSSKALFWLGTIFKTNGNIKVLDLARCNIDNDCLYMFVEGTKFSNENLNNEMLNLDRLILKDNNQITDISNNQFEHPLGLILRRFKLKWLNLTNAKLGNNGVCKFLKIYLSLMKENKIFMENLILICNAFGNEECLNLLGEIIQQKEISTLKTLVLSKNQITMKNINTPQTANYFENFMKCIVNSNLQELFLISCGIGKNPNDIQILIDMLCQNKSLTSLRLFGNDISKFEDFTKILGIFSEYNNGLKNTTLTNLDLSKNSCNIKISEDFLQLVEKLKLEYLDINQNTMDQNDKEIFRKRTNELNDNKIIY